MSLCILDKEVHSYRDTNFFVKDTDTLEFPENLKLLIKKFIKAAAEVGLLYPTIKIKDNLVTLKYDQDVNYIIYTISLNKIEYAFGILGGSSKSGELSNLDQLKSHHNYVYGRFK